MPGQIDRLWSNSERGAGPRFILLVVDYAVGIGAFAMVVAGFFILLTAEQRTAIWQGLSLAPFVLLIGAGLFAAAVGGAGRAARGFLRGTRLGQGQMGHVTRSVGIFVSAAFLGLVLVGMLLIALSIVLVIIDSGHDHLANHQFVIGAIAVLVVFNLLARLGTWRWDIWDGRERRGLRRAPTTSPIRTWPYVLGLILTLLVFAATSIVALGAEGSSWWGISREAVARSDGRSGRRDRPVQPCKGHRRQRHRRRWRRAGRGGCGQRRAADHHDERAAAAGGLLRRRRAIGGRMAVPKETTMNFNSILIGSADPQRLVDYYTKLFGAPAMPEEGGYTGWQLGHGLRDGRAALQVQGKNAQPGRLIWNIETADVKGEFERLKAAGAIVVAEPYEFEGAPGSAIATLADPDDNYFQLMSPMDPNAMGDGSGDAT